MRYEVRMCSSSLYRSIVSVRVSSGLSSGSRLVSRICSAATISAPNPSFELSTCDCRFWWSDLGPWFRVYSSSVYDLVLLDSYVYGFALELRKAVDLHEENLFRLAPPGQNGAAQLCPCRIQIGLSYPLVCHNDPDRDIVFAAVKDTSSAGRQRTITPPVSKG